MALAALLAGCTATVDAGDDGEGDDTEGAVPLVDESPADSDGVAFSAAKVSHEAVFAVPQLNGQGDPAIENKILELINHTPKGAHIRISMFRWSRVNVAHAVVAASKRGVDVQIVVDKQVNQITKPARSPNAADDPLDEDEDSSPTLEDDALTADELAAAQTETVLDPAMLVLKHGLPAGALTFCTRGAGSCQGTNINHNKIYMFSRTGNSTYVVVQASANLSTHRLHNNAVISRNDHDLYGLYVHYFNDLKAHEENLDYYTMGRGHGTIGYFFPREEGDTIISILDKVHCKSDSRIRVAMAFFTDGRSAIADKLVSLHKAGCDVRVNMRHAGSDVSPTIIKTLKHGGVNVGLFPQRNGVNIHSKYLIIDAPFGTAAGHPHRHLVFTGSHNYTGPALRHNDEALLRIDDEDVFHAFMHNWNTIRDQIDHG